MKLLPPIRQTSRGTPRDLASLLSLESQGWGERPEVYGPQGHNGLDWPCVEGTPIHASHGGTIANLKDAGTPELQGGFGLYVTVTNDSGKTYYAHLSRYAKEHGTPVAAGDILGYSGNTGFSSGPHLHFGYKVDNAWVDPTSSLVWEPASTIMTEDDVRRLQVLEGYSDPEGVVYWTGKPLSAYLQARLEDKVTDITKLL